VCGCCDHSLTPIPHGPRHTFYAVLIKCHLIDTYPVPQAAACWGG
jgi:hypothetical protein